MESLVLFIQIVFINVLLSGDNAIVIAMASQHLPPAERKRAIFWGAAAAVGLRCVLTLVAISLLKIPYLQAAGAVLLFIIAVKLLRDAQEGGGHPSGIRKAVSLGTAVQTIVAADFVMSLDNVLAIAAIAEGQPLLILLGIGLSIPMIIWGSQLLGAVLRKFPPLIYIGAGLLGYAAGKMLVHDPGLNHILFHSSHTAAEAIPLLSIPFVIVLSLLKRRTS
ncbi:TerC family protein [Paenibacillus pinihumi]|uniref:TerC family protein n=1 Tax=Paenibacillus pinihumi TaxID=669462 RepID=UPI000423463B|nr:TerC family protein [Paenibacillus pinihumi]